MVSDQLPLPFPHQPPYAAADFLAAPSNEAALAWLDRTADWPDHRLAVWGQPGCGKTHLLRLWAGRHGAVLLVRPDLHGLPTLPASGGVAVDDAAASTDEAALLHLLNAAREARLPVLLAARTPPARWPARLPDLASRLRAITAVEIHPPGDDLLTVLLMHLLADRQLNVAPPVQDWLLTHLPRSPSVLRQAVARLDRISLTFGKPITRALAARILVDDGFAAADSKEASIAEANEVSMSEVAPSSQPPGFL